MLVLTASITNSTSSMYCKGLSFIAEPNNQIISSDIMMIFFRPPAELVPLCNLGIVYFKSNISDCILGGMDDALEVVLFRLASVAGLEFQKQHTPISVDSFAAEHCNPQNQFGLNHAFRQVRLFQRYHIDEEMVQPPPDR